jgi:hypothetical protein
MGSVRIALQRGRPGLRKLLGALDDDPGIRPSYRSFVDSKAPWDEIPDDGLPRYRESNPDA